MSRSRPNTATLKSTLAVLLEFGLKPTRFDFGPDGAYQWYLGNSDEAPNSGVSPETLLDTELQAFEARHAKN